MQLAGVEHQPWRPLAAWHFPPAIQVTAQNGMPKLLAVNAQLMGTPGLWRKLNARQRQPHVALLLLIKTFNHPIAGTRGLAAHSSN